MAVRDYLFTSESVTEGHPDKVADQISDSVLDAMLEQDPHSRVACEVLVTTGVAVVAGEITSKAQVAIEYRGGRPERVEAVVVSTQHGAYVSHEQIVETVRSKVIATQIPASLIDDNTKIYINPTGRFVIGGPHGDCGLTGRKIIV